MGDTFVQPDSSGAQDGDTYKNAIDASIAVLARLGRAFAPHEQATPDMTVRVDAGFVLTATGITEKVAASTGTIIAPSGNPRIDRVVIDIGDGSISVITGIEGVSPTPPDIPADQAPGCQILLDNSPATTAIANSLITDERAITSYGVDPHTAIITLANASVGLTVQHVGKRLLITPTDFWLILLPTTGVVAGDKIELHNLAPLQKFTIGSSDGDTICQFQDGWMELMALQATPTDSTHWRIVDGGGGARPSFFAHRNGILQNNILGRDQIEFNNAWTGPGFNNNGNYNTMLFRFEPTVPGLYYVYAQYFFLTGSGAGDAIACSIKRNTTEISIGQIDVNTNDFDTVSANVNVTMNGIGDYFEAFAENLNSNLSDISGAVASTYFCGHLVQY